MGNEAIWFSGWFTSIINTINSVKSAFSNINVMASHKNEMCAYKHAVDNFLIEPSNITSEEFISWAINICKVHNVKVLIPKRFMVEIAHSINKFEEIGVKVLCERADLIDRFYSKAAIYRELTDINYTGIPWYTVVSSANEFRTGYDKLNRLGKVACIKYDSDEGAVSFRVVNDKWCTIHSMQETLMNLISSDNMLKILEDGEARHTLKPMILMEKLDGPEISVDCYYSTQFGFIAIPRYKMGNRIKEIRLNNSVIEDAKRLYEFYKFNSIFNIQYRWGSDGDIKLLEINPRMSGGIHLSSLCGFSLPIQAIGEMLGVGVKQNITDISNCIVTQYETPMIL